MPLTNKERRDLLLVERSRDAPSILAALQAILLDNETVTLLDCEVALRDAAAKTYLVAGKDGLLLCGSMPDALAALREAGSNPGENWIALMELTKALRTDSGPDRTV